jgi:hypothetical protein
MSIETMKQALEALEWNLPVVEDWGGKDNLSLQHKAITALRQAIEKSQKQEPFGYFQFDLRLDAWVQNRHSDKGVAFYTSPPQRHPLTDEEILQTAHKRHARINNNIGNDLLLISFARAIEAAHGIKGEA